MRSLAALCIAMLLAILFASCGGGGGGSAVPPPPPGPSPSPSMCPSPSMAYPPEDCTAFALSGTSTQTITRFAPTPTPPALVTNSAVTQNAVVHNNQLFHGTTATDFKTTETDVGPNQTITSTLDVYFVFPPGGVGNVLNIGFHSTDSNGVILDVQYLSGNGIVDQLPETTGAAWSNSAAATIVENDPDGTKTTQNINPDGSYTATKTEVAGTTTVTENSNGTATEIVPLLLFPVGTGSEFSVGLQSGGFIPFTVSAVGAPAPTPTPTTLFVPAWYPQAPVLASDQTTDQGVTTIPPRCAAPAFGPTGTQLHEVRSRIDTILGYTDGETVDVWNVAGTGPVCEEISDTVNLYYDFTGQLSTLTLSGTPIQTTTLSETVGLQSVTPGSLARHPLGVRRSTPWLAPGLAVARERVERFHQAFRARQLRSMRDFLKRGLLK